MGVKGESDQMTVPAAVEMIRGTPPERRSEFAHEIWSRRRERYGPSGRSDSVPFLRTGRYDSPAETFDTPKAGSR